jgi:hypothetical protein
MAMDWQVLAKEINQFGNNYTVEQLQDPDWCIKEIARKGYAINITYITREYAKSLFGRYPDYPPEVNGLYRYGLWGPRYTKIGDHSSPVTDNLADAAATALFNLCHLDWHDLQDSQTAAKH